MEKHMNTDRPIAITLQELRFCRNKIIILCHVKQQLRQRLDSYRFQNRIIAIDNEITILKHEVVLLNKKLPVMRELNGAQRRMIEVYRDRIMVLKQNKIRLLQQQDSSSKKIEIDRINEQIRTNKDALIRIYANSNFCPMDIYML